MISAATLLARCRAVLLDMDGTLVNSHAAVEAAWGRQAQELAAQKPNGPKGLSPTKSDPPTSKEE